MSWEREIFFPWFLNADSFDIRFEAIYSLVLSLWGLRLVFLPKDVELGIDLILQGGAAAEICAVILECTGLIQNISPRCSVGV